jgi:DNA-binding transcriptional regulator YiaG
VSLRSGIEWIPVDVPPPREHGETRYNSRLTEKIVRQIRSRSATGTSRADLARLYGVSHKTVLNVITGRAWKHVANEPTGP